MRHVKDRAENVAWEVRAAIMALPDIPEAFTMVPACFANVKGSKADKGEAFRLLDERPSAFGGSYSPQWHQLLRRCRNHSIHGRELFAVWG